MTIPKRWLIVVLLRDAEDPGELVLQRAGPVELDVGCGERQPLAAPREKGLERGLVALGDQLPPALGGALLVEQVGVEAGVAQRRTLLRGDRLLEQVVDHRQGVRHGLLARALDQAGELDELEEPGHGPVDVDIGVEPRLAKLAAGAPGLLEDLVLDHPVGGLQALGRPEELLAVLLLGCVQHGAGVLVEGRGASLSGLGRRRPRQHQVLGRPRHRDVEQPPRILLVRGRRGSDPGGNGGRAGGLRARHGPGVQADDVDPRELEPLGALQRHHPDRLGDRLVLLLDGRDPRLGNRHQVADEVAVRPARLAAHPGLRELTEAREVAQALRRLGVRGEEPMSPEADPLDQPAHEDVGSHLAHGPGRRAVELQELPDPIAGLGRDLRALERGLQRGDHVELAAPGDRRAAGEVDRAQLHRRPAEGADRRGGVGGVGQESKPGDHVAHLGALEEGAGAAQPVGNAPLLERGGDRPRRASAARDGDADLLHLHLARGEGALDVASHGLGLGALVRPGPEANPSRRSGRSARNVGAAGRGRHHRVRRVEQVAAVAPGGLQRDLARLDRLPRPGRGGIAGPPALLVVAGEDRGGRAARRAPRSATARRGRRPRARRRADAGSARRSILPAPAARRAAWSAPARRRCRPWRPPRGASSRGARRSRRTPAPWRRSPARNAFHPPARRPSGRSARPSRRRTSARRSGRRSGRGARRGCRGSHDVAMAARRCGRAASPGARRG